MVLKELFSGDGIKIFNIKEDKFKTNTINVFFVDNLSRDTVAKNALMMAVLKRGTNKYPKTLELEKRMDELYGLGFGCDIYKKGETNVLQFYAGVIHDEFAIDNENLIEEAFSFLNDIILNPYKVNGLFKEEYVETEKSNLVKLINSKINDKMDYANQSLIENMCKDEPYGIYEYGKVEDYDNIKNEDLVKNYERMLKSMPMYIFVSGDVSDDTILNCTEYYRNLKRDNLIKVEVFSQKKSVLEEKVIIESMDIVQDKFCMGFRTNIEPYDDEYAYLMVYDSILGGGVSSRLFNNIREKNSLCYYIRSNLYRYKGIMVVSTGIDSKNKDIVRKMILNEIEDMKSGNITDLEIDTAKKSLQNALEALKDKQQGMVDFNFTNMLFNFKQDINDFMRLINSAKREDIVRVSKNIILDTEYVLTSKSK